jgi:hypothetical protein
MRRMDLYDVFQQGAIDDAALIAYRLGALKLEGRIGAADPLAARRIEPFTQEAPVGSFPVDVLVVTTGNDARVAFARVLFRDVAPVRFEIAFCAGHAPQLEDGRTFAYPVDAGTGCFADPDVVIDGDELLDAFRRTQVDTWFWAISPDARLVAFASGVGDGGYTSFFGLDGDGEPVCLVTDFKIVPLDAPAERWTRAENRPIEAPGARRDADRPDFTARDAMLDESERMQTSILLDNGRDEVRRQLQGGSFTARVAAAHALGDELVLREVAETEGVDLEIRFACIGRLKGEPIRCDLYTKLAEAGHARAVELLVKMLKGRLTPPAAITERLNAIARTAKSSAVQERVRALLGT